MNKLMCHVVAGFPDTKTCLKLMQGMDRAKVAAIEVQVPFSDPIADGETIMAANDVALEQDMTVKRTFDLIQEARDSGVSCDIFIMTYIQKAQHYGIIDFCEAARAAGVKGLIIPDLPYDSSEYQTLIAETGRRGLDLIPVLSPGMSLERLSAILKNKAPHLYVTSQRGITGNAYHAGAELNHFVGTVRKTSNAQVMIGFGIRDKKDVRDALKIGDVAVIGSAVIKRLQAGDVAKTLEYIASLVEGKA